MFSLIPEKRHCQAETDPIRSRTAQRDMHLNKSDTPALQPPYKSEHSLPIRRSRD